MKKGVKISAILGTLACFALNAHLIYAKEVQIEKYTLNTSEQILSTERMINSNTIQYSKPSTTYDFVDENGLYNSVYTSQTNVYWSKFDSNMNETSTVKIPMYFDKSNSSDFMKDLVYNFGNAIYYNDYLYIVYGQEAKSASSTSISDVTMTIVKYDKQGNAVKTTELIGTQVNPTNWWNLGGGDWTYGTYLPFYPNSNCSLTVSDGIIGCFFGRQMFMPHSSSMLFFIDANTLEYVNNRYYTSEENVLKYQEVSQYYTSHSMGQRIIGTKDGGYMMAELGDAGGNGSTRGLMVSKIYPEDNILKISTSKMIHFREGTKGSHGYNSTFSSLGNIIELKSGYMYIGSMEPTLSLAYGQPINESWNIFAQKYTSDFWKKDSIQDMQLFNTPIRKEEGVAPDDANLGVNASEGRIYLKGNEEDYGIKWLTDFENKYLTVLVRAVKIKNDNIAILYEQLPINAKENGGYSLQKDSDSSKTYFMIIDSNANIISEPIYIENAVLSDEELYVYSNNKIYWTTSNGSNYITVNVLDLNEYLYDDTPTLLKGDLDKNGIVDANDAAVALDLYKYNSATKDDLEIGDMDENGLIDANDASLILDVYKYGN